MRSGLEGLGQKPEGLVQEAFPQRPRPGGPGKEAYAKRPGLEGLGQITWTRSKVALTKRNCPGGLAQDP